MELCWGVNLWYDLDVMLSENVVREEIWVGQKGTKPCKFLNTCNKQVPLGNTHTCVFSFHKDGFGARLEVGAALHENPRTSHSHANCFLLVSKGWR